MVAAKISALIHAGLGPKTIRRTGKAIRDGVMLITEVVVAVLLTLVFLMLSALASYGLSLADYIRRRASPSNKWRQMPPPE
jgi:hypothetical protein